jgi:hypothetical protein
MADEQVQVEKQEQVESQAKEQDTQDIEKMIAEANAKLKAELEERYKKEIAGLNKRNSELEGKVKKTELEKMSEAERIEAERKELEAEKQAIKQQKIDLMVAKELANSGLPEEFAKRISGETEDEIKADVKWLKDFLTSKAHELSEGEIAKRLGGEAPKGGQKPDVSTLQGMYDKAKTRNDVAGMVAIKRQAKQAGEVLKEF